MKKIWIVGLLTLALLLAGAAFADQEDAPVLLVQLPEDAQMVENVAFDDGELLCYVEGSPETWNRRFRISNLCIFEDAGRRRGIGTALMDTIAKAAAASGARMLVLETQSCNERAIAFYRKNGFSVIGFDLYAYSNRDPERHEVRVEMGKRLDQAGISG